MMYKAEFELEAITPIFMRGANQNRAEIRAPSIKGVMRWWFRALAGNYFGSDIVGLRKAEEYVFGSTNQRNKVSIQVEANGDNPKPIRADYDIKYDYKKGRLRPKVKSVRITVGDTTTEDIPNYLFFSIKMLVDDIARSCLENVLSKHGIRNRFRDENHMRSILERRGLKYPGGLKGEFQREFNRHILTYYSPRTKFHIKIGAFDEEAFKIALMSFWALVTLGSIGFRARRGAGSIGIKRIVRVHPEELKDEIFTLFSYNWRQIDDAIKIWSDSFKRLYDKFRDEDISKKEKENEILEYPSIRELIVLEYTKPFNTAIDALKVLEQAYAGELKEFRRRKRYEGGVRFEFADRKFSHKVIEKFNKVEEDIRERRFYFGLPVIYANWRTEVNGYNENNSNRPFRRRGSSVILTVKKDNEKYIPLVVVIPYQFLPYHNGRFIAIKGNEMLDFKLPTNNKWFVNWLKNDVVKEFERKDFGIVCQRRFSR